MNKVLITIILISVQYVYGQDNAVDKFYRDYQQKYSLDVVSLSGKMLEVLIDDKKAQEKEALGNIIKKLTGLKMLSKQNPKDGNELFLSANGLLPKQYNTILSMDETDRKVKCYTMENKDGKISELVMVAWQWGRFLVLSITGDIDLKEIYKLTRSLNFGSLSVSQKGLY